jgi:hypothetical protein
MDIGSILLLLALVVVVSAYIASPLRLRPAKRDSRIDDMELSQLLSERERVLEALAELDFDNEMEKVPEDLYPLQREALVKRGAAVLRLLDERMPAGDQTLAGDSTPVGDRTPEATRAVPEGPEPESDPLEALIYAKRKSSSVKIAKNVTKDKFCANCGKQLVPGDRFCSSCGHQV